MYKTPVRLDRGSDLKKFVAIANTIPGIVRLVDDDGLVVDAKSYLGVVCAALEWRNVYCLCDEEVSEKFLDFLK